MLDQAVLPGMITDHRKGAAGYERVAECRQCPLQSRQLVVHGEPDRLEDPVERTGPPPGAGRRPDRSHEVITGDERGAVAATDDLGRQPPGTRLVAPVLERIRQVELGGSVEPFGRGGGIWPHPHVQWCSPSEREAALLGVEL